MKVEDLVLSIDQMQHLKELGVEVKDTALCIIPRESGHKCYVPTEVVFPQDEETKIPTLTLQEMLDLLPKVVNIPHVDYYTLELDLYDRCCISYDGEVSNLKYIKISTSLLDAAYKMLCWCTENGYLNNKENE